MKRDYTRSEYSALDLNEPINSKFGNSAAPKFVKTIDIKMMNEKRTEETDSDRCVKTNNK